MENAKGVVSSPQTSSSVARQTILFAQNFFRHPRLLGSVVPSSPYLVNQLLAPVDWQRAEVIVEFGPGIGNITRQVLRRMRPDTTLVAIELNRAFVNFLQNDLQDPRFKVVEGSALDVKKILTQLGLQHADYIISGIPYTNIPHRLRAGIMKEAREMIHPEGAMLVYQFTRTVRPYLEESFSSVREDFALWNIFPARTFHCTP